jgi:hypothetical protein
VALALISKKQDADLWRREMAGAIPGLDFRVWPELGDERQIRMAAFDFNWTPPDIFQRLPQSRPIPRDAEGAIFHGARHTVDRVIGPASGRRAADPSPMREE